MSLRYVFMGSPGLAATILETLCTELYPPVAVVTQTAKAQGRGHKVIPTEVERFARTQDLNLFSTDDINAPATVGALKPFDPDLILVAAFGQIFRAEVLALPKKYCLNVHASLLPSYRGAAPVQRAIWNGERQTGVTIQKMAKKLDAGDILIQKTIPILPEDTSHDLLIKLARLGAEALCESVRLIESGKETFTAQEEALASFAPKIEKSDSPLDWSKSAESLGNQIRALQPWPVAETQLGKDRLRVFKAKVEQRSPLPNAAPGSVFTDAKTYLSVQCGDGKVLSLTEIQLENRKRLEINQFLMAYRGSFPYSSMGFVK